MMRLAKFGLLLFILTGNLLSAAVNPVRAQDGEQAWSTPVNLSNSGSASSPFLINTVDGQMQAIWFDEIAGWVFSQGNGVEWSQPQPGSYPFDTFIPSQVVTDPAGNAHAFWLEEGELTWSYVRPGGLASGGSWNSPSRLAEPVVAMDAVSTPRGQDETAGRMHLAYVQGDGTDDSPAGVYYRQIDLARLSWGAPVKLYESPYFRSLAPDAVRVSVAVDASGQNVYAAWDNPARERVFLARSVDGGQTWGEPLEVASPLGGSVAGGPSNIQVGVQGQNVLLTWQSDRSGPNCSQYVQASLDGGETWGEQGRLLADMPGCAEQTQFLTGEGEAVYLLAVISDQAYLLAWNGAEWSAPQLQGALSTFVDPDTNRPVRLGCRQVQRAGNSLMALGCAQGDSADIWTTSRTLENIEAWFTDNRVWTAPAAISSGPLPARRLVVTPDGEGRLHVLWGQPASALPESRSLSLFYARYQDGEWSRPQAVLSSPLGVAEDPAATVSPDGRLLVVWSGGESGEIYFSSVDASKSALLESWSAPQLLPGVQRAGSSPDILVDSRGVIYVAYAIPLNEQRGVYLTRSTDGGQTWSDPVLVFDAVSVEWAMVDRPELGWTENGNLYATWMRASLPSGAGSLGLFFARSGDDGATWSQAETVSDKPVLWSYLSGIGERTVHRMWQEVSGGRLTLWHEVSQDSGATWSRVSPVTIFGETAGFPAVAQDRAGRLHLLQLVRNAPGSYSLQHWIWDGQSWVGEQTLEIQGQGTELSGGLAAAVSPAGALGAVYTGYTVDAEDGSRQEQIFFTGRSLELPEGLPTPLPPLPTGAAEVTETPAASQPTVTPTVAMPETGSLGGPGENGGNAWAGSIIGPLVAALIVLAVVVATVRGAGLGRR